MKAYSTLLQSPTVQGSMVVADPSVSNATVTYSAGKLEIHLDSGSSDGVYFRQYRPGIGYANNVIFKANGYVGINKEIPEYHLDIGGTVASTGLKVVDGNQVVNKVLTSDANGVATWQYPKYAP